MAETDRSRLPLTKALDMPPVWLVLFVVLARIQAVNWPVAQVEVPLVDLAAGVMVGAGVLLMGLALMEMRRARTTIIPHMEADALVTTGVFNRSRNPIYLGDALILTGLILRWDAVLALPLIPIFVWLLERRFILPEEARLAARFGPAYDAYAGRVRRWL